MSKLRRSMLFVPGASAAMLSNTFIYQPDAIMFDLEDSVALREKDTARMMVFNALQHPLYQEIETVVRVNPLESEFGLKDLHAVVRAGVNVVRLPKQTVQKTCKKWSAALKTSNVYVAEKLAAPK